MAPFSRITNNRRKSNAAALEAFGLTSEFVGESGLCRIVREGTGPTLFTIGYEKRDSEDLISSLVNVGIEVLIDVRERPISRVPDFRKNALEAACVNAGIKYESRPELGSTSHQRERLRESGDFSEFKRRFRDFARRGREAEIEDLANMISKTVVALICYERLHEECHRSILADLVADQVDAHVIAIC